MLKNFKSANAGGGITLLSKENFVDIVYPVGSIYMSINKTSPQILFGGTWEEIPGDYYFITTPHNQSVRGVGGSFYTDNTVLTIDQIPNHAHEITCSSNPTGVPDTYDGWGFEEIKLNKSNWGAVTNPTGEGQGHNHKYQPPFYQVWAWVRTS